MAKGTLKRKDHFSLQNKVFSQETPEKKHPGLQSASRSNLCPLPNRKHSLDASFLQWRNPASIYFTVTASLELNPLPRAGRWTGVWN